MKKLITFFCSLILLVFFFGCISIHPNIDNSILIGSWWYFTNDSNYIEIYIGDSLIREQSINIGISPIAKYKTENNEINIIGNRNNDYYLKITKIVSDTCIEIINSKGNMHVLKKLYLPDYSYSCLMKKEKCNSSFELERNNFMIRAVKNSNSPNKDALIRILKK